MPDTREKLIELLTEAEENAADFCIDHHCEDCPARKFGMDCRKSLQADRLIAEGVTFAKDTNVLTNADRIRAMSDEELAKVPAKFGYSCVFPQKECSESDTCEKCLLNWLKQPAEVPEGD